MVYTHKSFSALYCNRSAKHSSAHVHAACTAPWSATKISPKSFIVVESHTNWLLAVANLQEETLYSESDYGQRLTSCHAKIAKTLKKLR